MDEVRSLFQLEEMSKDRYFLKEGQYNTRLSFIRSGLMRIYAERDGKEITQWISSPGYFVVDLKSFMFNDRARWNIKAITDCELFSISKENYQLLPHRVQHWAELEKRFLATCFVTLEDRVFRHLSQSAEERYNEFFAESKELFNQVPLQYIASMLGMTPETFSRIRARKLS